MKISEKKSNQQDLQPYLDAGYDVFTAKVLYHRGIDPQTAELFKKDPRSLLLNPRFLPGVELASDEIIQFLKSSGNEIWVFSDYDADGLTSGYILTHFLKQLTQANDIYPYYPERADGYALSMNFCEAMVKRKQKTGKNILVITVDNGVTQISEVAYLKESGISVIVTDHHMPKGVLPDCIVVDPHIEPKNPLRHLAGCGVAYKLAEYINHELGKPVDMDQYLFAVALGTVADIMPMTIENIAFVLLGLEQIKTNKSHHGLQSFIKALGLEKGVTPIDVSFELAPRLNACGRMGDIETGAALFYLEYEEELHQINELIEKIETLNNERKALTQRLKNELVGYTPETKFSVMYDISNYPDGIAAIAAGRISEQFSVPAIAYSCREGSVCRGSVRSVPGVNILTVLEKAYNEGLVLQFGGHEEAAGISFKKKHQPALAALVDDEVELLVAELMKDTPVASMDELYVDAFMTLSDIKQTTYDQINLFPYDRGAKFPEPVFAFGPLRVMSSKRSKNNPLNIAFTVEDINKKKQEIWAWGAGKKYTDMKEPEYIYLVGSVAKDFMRPKHYTARVNAVFQADSPEVKKPRSKLLRHKKVPKLQI